MPVSPTAAHLRSSKGGLRRAALAPTRESITAAARSAFEEGFRQQIREALPDLKDEAEIERRADLLRRAHMTGLSLMAAKARKLKAELRKIEAELDASGLEGAGSDGVDAG